MDLTLLNCTLRNGKDGKFCVMYILLQLKKKKLVVGQAGPPGAPPGKHCATAPRGSPGMSSSLCLLCADENQSFGFFLSVHRNQGAGIQKSPAARCSVNHSGGFSSEGNLEFSGLRSSCQGPDAGITGAPRQQQEGRCGLSPGRCLTGDQTPCDLPQEPSFRQPPSTSHTQPCSSSEIRASDGEE